MVQETLQIQSNHEWILTNGIGGYALGFGNMTNKRKYDGLLIAARPDLSRVHVLASIEELVEDGNVRFYLDSNYYPNCTFPDGIKNLVKVWLRPYPCALYSPQSLRPNYMVFKEVFMVEDKNVVVVKYSNLGKKEVRIHLRPKFTLRDHHYVNHRGTWDSTQLETEVNENSFKVKRVDLGLEAYGFMDHGRITQERIVYSNVYYPVEMLRGYDATEDVIGTVKMSAEIGAGKNLFAVFSFEPMEEPLALAKSAEKKYKKLTLPIDHPERQKDVASLMRRSVGDILRREDYSQVLALAAQDFVVNGNDMIAGYPWFGAWGRDSLISMGGLRLLPGGKDVAVSILLKYGSKIRDGLLPNTFGEGGAGLNYDTVDAPLLYVIRSYELAPSNQELFTNSRNIVLNYINSPSLPFFMADDGLIEIRKGDQALTWMDAKVYGVPVTPRTGKPVEINAMWYNALCALLEMAKSANVEKISHGQYSMSINDLKNLIDKVRSSMQVFIGPQYLADRIEDTRPIWEIRPNAVTALSLPFDFTDRDVMKKVWKMAKDALLTPYGLRTLDPLHPGYKQKYIGNQKQRDFAYHQGTVWPYFIAPFAALAVKALLPDSTKTEVVKELVGYVWTFREGFMRGEFSSVAEVWDGTDPYFPKGCPAQAWSVFALLEVEHMIGELSK